MVGVSMSKVAKARGAECRKKSGRLAFAGEIIEDYPDDTGAVNTKAVRIGKSHGPAGPPPRMKRL